MKITHEILEYIVIDALLHQDGTSTPAEVGKYIWENYNKNLKKSGNMFYTWQYDLRWAKHRLQKAGNIQQPERGVWELTDYFYKYHVQSPE